eukprot:1158067-Pelagomonas_calceolata.AAC.4
MNTGSFEDDDVAGRAALHTGYVPARQGRKFLALAFAIEGHNEEGPYDVCRVDYRELSVCQKELLIGPKRPQQGKCSFANCSTLLTHL